MPKVKKQVHNSLIYSKKNCTAIRIFKKMNFEKRKTCTCYFGGWERGGVQLADALYGK